MLFAYAFFLSGFKNFLNISKANRRLPITTVIVYVIAIVIEEGVKSITNMSIITVYKFDIESIFNMILAIVLLIITINHSIKSLFENK